MVESEWRADVHTGYRTTYLTVGNCTIEVHRPILDPQEQKRRENQIIEALKHFGKEKTS